MILLFYILIVCCVVSILLCFSLSYALEFQSNCINVLIVYTVTLESRVKELNRNYNNKIK